MEIDESKMQKWEEPSVRQKTKNAVVALLFGVFLLRVTPAIFAFVFFPNLTFFYIIVCLYAAICLLLGWFYGHYFISYLHAKIEEWWEPRDMFR